jgi:hypothetical protein
MRCGALSLVCLISASACDGRRPSRAEDGAALFDGASQLDGADQQDADVAAADAASPDSGSPGDAHAMDIGDAGDRARAVCQRWMADRADLDEGLWTGDVASCQPGDVTGSGRANALRVWNLYRFLAGLPPLSPDAQLDTRAEACALLMIANGDVTHEPPMTWRCYDYEAALTAGSSLLATGAAVEAVDWFVIDSPAHRSFILTNLLGSAGIGSAFSGMDGYCCLTAPETGTSAGRLWTAWPPEGPVPVDVFSVAGSSLDATGWTVNSDRIDLNSAQVDVQDGAQSVGVDVQPPPLAGASYQVVFSPRGWQTQAGHTYAVAVSASGQTINYQVEVVSCP